MDIYTIHLNRLKKRIKMSKKILALIIILVIMGGVYGFYYIYATTVVLPEDVKNLKIDYNTLPTTGINQSYVNDLNTDVSKIQSGSFSYSNNPQSERQQSANDMRSYYQTEASYIQNLNQSNQNSSGYAIRYDLILKGNIANEWRSVYDDDTGINLLSNMNNVYYNIINDEQTANDTAFIKDAQQYMNLSQQYNNWTITSQQKLQVIINQLGG